jgi:3-hydroxybutyryl-CoA dehydrogenase
MQRIERVLVVGAGTMGAGIAEVVAKAGMEAILCDVSEETLSNAVAKIAASLSAAVTKGKLEAAEAEATRSRIQTTSSYEAASGAQLLIEAVPELMELKKQIFRDLAAINPDAVLATNTSSLSVTELAAATPRPAQVIGLHFFNPPPVMPLLEIVRAEQTEAALVEAMRAFATLLGKTPIVVKDMPGFATSRLGVLLGLEAMRMLEQGVASAEDIDRAMELGYRHPMGPLKLTDLVGLDVRLSIADHLAREVGPQFAAPPILRQLVRAGKLGKKSGEGFYRWVQGQAVAKDHR